MTERDIFLAALEITDTTARKAHLDKACAGNAVLRAAVEALFASHEGAGSFLTTPIVQTPGTTSSADTKADDPPGSSSAAVEQTVHFAPGQAANMDDDDDDNTANEIPLGYLAPSKKPDSLGRLGHYEVLQVLGKGAFGTVLKAFDEKLHRMVAIKVMSIELASTSPARKRFLREARASAAIRHDNVVAIYAVEEHPIPYLVMEYIPGKTLADALIGEGPLELKDALRLGQQIASGLAAAHSQGLIHRDIKPANILLEEGIQWKVKITDFGLARAADDASVTQSGTIAGTPMFMSPEQAHSSNIDQRSDLFSFGSVMYQMVSGRPPFRAASTLAVLKRVTEDTPRPIQEIIPEVPDWLVTIISKLHEKKADDRYQTAQEVADLLARCQSELQHVGKVTCVESSHHAPCDEAPSTHVRRGSPDPAETADRRSPARPGTHQNTGDLRSIDSAGPGDPRTTGTTESSRRRSRETSDRIRTNPAAAHNSSRRSETATFKRPLLFTAFLVVAAIVAAVAINRDKSNPDLAHGTPRPTDSGSQIGNQKSPIENPSWQGWSADAPPPAIPPFNAERARQHQEAWAKYLNVPVEFTNSIGMKFRLIPPGEFLMGSTDEAIEEALKHAGEDKHWQECIRSEGPQHKVILTQPIYLGVYEVTQAEYEKVIGKNPSHLAPTGAGKALVEGIDTSRHPVEMVNWHDAAEFCAKLSQQEELKPFYFSGNGTITLLDGTGYRLPTEAEWEYACRAGTKSKFWNGDTDDDLVRAGWFSTNTGGRTHSVGELKKNPYGLSDTHGNVWEWVQDGWKPTFYSEFSGRPALDPNVPYSRESLQAVRGGSWNDYSSSCRVTNRQSVVPLLSNHFLGFRVSLPVDAVRTSLKRTGPAIPKPQAMELSNTNPASEKSDSKFQMPETNGKPVVDYAPEQKAAEWLLSVKRAFAVRDQSGIERWGGTAADLPEGPFNISIVSLQQMGDVVTDEGLSNLRGLTGLEQLDLTFCSKVTDAGIAHLSGCVSLKSLLVQFVPVTDKCVDSLSRMANLERLDFQETSVRDEGFHRLVLDHPKLIFVGLPQELSETGLADLQKLGSLTSLAMRAQYLTSANLPHFRQLTGVRDWIIAAAGDEQVRIVAELPQVESLLLHVSAIRPSAVDDLARLPKLIRLNLDQVSNDHAEAIAQLNRLTVLQLRGQDLNDAGLKHLHGMSGLKELGITQTGASESGVRELQAALPNCKILSAYSDIAAK